MKRILKAFVILLLIAAAALGFALYNMSSIVAKFKPEIERAASKAVGTPVSLGNLSASVIPTVGVEVDRVLLGKKGAGFALENVLLKAQLMPLFSGKLVITEVRIVSPQVKLLRSASGDLSVAGLPKKGPAGDTHQAPHDATAPTNTEKTDGARSLPLNLEVQAIRLERAGVILQDEVSGRSAPLVEDFSLFAKVAVEGGNSATISDINGSGKILGHATLKVAGSAAKVGTPDGSLNTQLTLSGFDLARVVDVANIMGQSLPPGVNGQFDIGVKADGAVTAPRIHANVNGRLNGEAVEVTTDVLQKGSAIEISSLLLKAFAGEVKGSATFGMKNDGAINIALDGGGLELARLLSAATPDGTPPITGRVESLSLKLTGQKGSNMLNSLAGPVSLKLVDGAIKGQNLVGDILRAVNNLPFMQGSLYEQAKESPEGDSLESSDTTLREVVLDGGLASGVFQLATLRAETPLATLRASGQMRLDGALDLKSELSLTKNLSLSLAANSKGIEKSLDSSQRLTIPVVIQGVAPKLVVLPDIERLVQLGATKAVEDAAKKALGKALGGDKGKGLGKILGF